MQQRKALSGKIEESIIQAIIRKWEKEKDILYLPESMKELYIICNVHFCNVPWLFLKFNHSSVIQREVNMV